MFPLSPTMWGAIAVALLVAGLGAALKIQTSRLDACKAEFGAFQAEVKVLGEQAEIKARMTEETNRKAKERADNENSRAKRDLAGVYDAYGKLLHATAGRSPVPAAAAGAADPDRACFSRAALDRGLAAADGVLQEGAVGILRRGDSAIVDLNTAKAWAQTRPP